MHRQVILRHSKNAPTIHKIDTVLTGRKYVPTVHNTLQKNCQLQKLRPTVTGRDMAPQKLLQIIFHTYRFIKNYTANTYD